MQPDAPNLTDRLATLRTTFDTLASDIRVAADRLAEGAPPESTLADRLRTAATTFAELRQEVEGLTRELDAPTTDAEALTDLEALESTLAAIHEAERNAEVGRQRATDALRRIGRLTTREGTDDVSGLPDARAMADDLLSEDAFDDETAHALSDGTHPIAALLALVDRTAPRAQRADLERIVEEAFDVELRIAAAYGDLVEADEPTADEPSEESEPPTTTEEPEPTALTGPEPEPEPEPETEHVASEEPTAVDGYEDPPATPEPEPEAVVEEPPETEAQPETESELEDGPEPEPIPDPFEENTTAADVVRALLRHPTKEVGPELLWALVQEGRPALAYHLARAAGGTAPSPILPTLGAPFLRALVLGPHLQSNVGEIASLLQDDFAAIDEHRSDARSEAAQAVHLLAFAAALRPALLAPHTTAPFVLEQLDLGGLPNLRSLVASVAEYATRGQPLKVATSVDDDWEAHLGALRAEAAGWLETAEARTIRYQAGTRVWQHWARKGGALYSLIDAVHANRVSKAPEVRARVEVLSDHNELGHLIDDFTENVLGKRQRVKHGARDELLRRAEEALDIPRRWLDLLAKRPAEPENWVAEQSQHLCHTLITLHAPVSNELDELERAGGARPLLRAVQEARATLNAAVALAQGQDAPTPEPSVKHLLHLPLLKVSGLPLGPEWAPELPPLEEDPETGELRRPLLAPLLEHIAAEDPDWEEAFAAQCAAEDHLATTRIIELLDEAGAAPDQLEPLRRRRTDELTACQSKYNQHILETLGEVEEAAALLLLQEEYEALQTELVLLQAGLPERDRFADLAQRLTDISADVAQRRTSAAEEVRARIATAEFSQRLSTIAAPTPDDETPYADAARQRIEDALAGGDLLLAQGYVSTLLDGRPLPAEDGRQTAFDAFFPGECSRWATELDQAKGAPFNRFVKHLEANGMSREADMVKAWASAGRRPGHITKEQAATILSGLGFNVSSVEVDQPTGRTYLSVQVEPLADRALCPVPSFGSLAKGHYRVLCVWGDPSIEDLLAQIDAVRGHVAGRAMLVFYFGRLDVERRRELARRAVEKRSTFALIDDLLLVFLLTRYGPRLRTFFECALPFTFVEPYTTGTSGWVPPEMFYGRRDERKRLLDPQGPALVYGGRQLGKTALLWDVHRQFEADAPDHHVAEFVDLRQMAFGEEHGPEEIWPLLLRRLKERSVLPADAPPNTGPDKIREHIQAWLAEVPQRRLLLLLDEADRFLASDEADGFKQCDRLVSLVVETERRVKVVFAGLHNVLRFTRRSNHPLAHLGEPIQIGPLIREESVDGHHLIEDPFTALGFRFDPPSLVSLIRFYTNSYPSLLQLYGDRLLKDLNRSRQNRTDAPPHAVRRADVDRASRSAALRDAIRGKFELTLDLDPRYALLTYLIAFHSLEGSADDHRRGFAPDWIRTEALEWWADGFRGAERQEDFVALLDELEGLGVLRRLEAPDGSATPYYTLRSPNLLQLLGSKKDLGRKIESFLEREQPPEFNRATYRAPSRHGPHEFRAPLTIEQTDTLLGPGHRTAILVGTPAADLNAVPNFLRRSDLTIEIARDLPAPQRDALAGYLDHLWDNAKGSLVVYIPRDVPWSETWVETAADWTTRRRASTRSACVAFEAGPEETWTLEGDPEGLANLEAKGAALVTLQPWHADALQRWLSEGGLHTAEERRRVVELTGNWPFLLQHLHGASSVSLRSAIEAFTPIENDPDLAKAFLEAAGLGTEGPHKEILLYLALADGGEGTPPERIADGTAQPLPLVERVLRWADRLSLARPVRHGRWRPNPVVANALMASA